DIITELLTKLSAPPAPTPSEGIPAAPPPPAEQVAPPPPPVEAPAAPATEQAPPVADAPGSSEAIPAPAAETPPVANAPGSPEAAPPAPPPEPKPDPAAVLIGLPPAPPDLAYIIVNEAGASDYSTTEIAKEEFPTFDPTLRSS